MDATAIIEKMFEGEKGPFRPSVVAKKLNCDKRTVQKMCQNGTLFSFHIGNEYRIPIEAIPSLINTRRN